MNFTFKDPSLKKQRFQLNAKIAVPVTLILAGTLIISALLDLWGSRRELSHILEEQSKAIITALEKGSQNAIASYDLVQDIMAERLLDNARLLEDMDFSGTLTKVRLQEISRKNKIFRINVYDADGQKVMASFRGFGRGATKPAADDLMTAIQKEGNDELVMGFRGSRFGDGRRFAVAKKRRNGGAIVLNVDSQEMHEFRKSIGLGKLIRDIGDNEGVAYIALQDTSAIIIATHNVDSLSTIQGDEILRKTLATGQLSTRFVTFKDSRIFEIVHLFDSENHELLRIGLNASHIEEAEKSALVRAILSTFLLLIFGGVFAGWFISSQNVKSLENAYQRIETYTGRMLENMTDAVVAVDKNGNITLVNNAAEKLFGISSAAIMGKPCALEIVAICPHLKTGLETREKKVYHEETLMTHKNTITAFINVNIIHNSASEVDTVFAVIRDMTELKRLEENLKRKDQITAMGHLASGVAHEIRNPLNAIGMIAQRLKAEFKPEHDVQEYDQLSTTVVSETRRINDIIQQFLKFARPADLVKTRVNVNSLLEESAILLQSHAEKKGVLIAVRCQDTPDITVDADKLKQVFLNIGRNAVDACSAHDKIELACKQNKESLLITISDTGQGMTEMVRKKIFNLYFTTREHGTGIGLSVVQQIVSQHDGTIDVRSEENKGTTFTITVPIA